jgi:DNA-binding transcriptional MerR regulator/methylmalonyl-CoA mutase cobalamin-binding subunit
MQPVEQASGKLLLGIGAVSRATGIPIPTLRTWERRYGTPTPERTEGGHRLYAPETVRRLSQVARALESGMRARQALMASPEELAALVGPAPVEQAPREGEIEVTAELAAWLAPTVALDGPGLDTVMRSDHARLGSMRFLVERAAPFLKAMGAWWAAGRLSVAQEHHASQRLALYLQSIRRELSASPDAPVAVVSGLPGERHLLGAQLVATTLSVAGWRVVDLGGDLPVGDIRDAAIQAGARAVAISISSTADHVRAYDDLLALGTGLPREVIRLVGGAGATRELEGWRRPDGLEGLAEAARLEG